MVRPLRSFGASLLAAVALAGLAACGGGSNSDEAKNTATSSQSTVKAARGGDFCDKIADTYNQASSFDLTAVKPPDELRRQLDTILKNGQEAIDEAPPEIKADLRIIQNGVKTIADALAKVGYDAARLGPDAISSFSALSTPEFQKASANSGTYVKDHCGLDLQPTTTGK